MDTAIQHIYSSAYIDFTPPTVLSTSPFDNQSGVSITNNILVTFSKAMDKTSITTNTDDTICKGSIQLSSDNFSSCIQMSFLPVDRKSPWYSKSREVLSKNDLRRVSRKLYQVLDRYWTHNTFEFIPDNPLSSNTYKARVTTEVKDSRGNTMKHNYETSPLFITKKNWTKQLGTSSRDIGNIVKVDSSDNIYVTGYTKGGLDGNAYSGHKDIFLVKYNPNGNKEWTKQLGTTLLDVGEGMAVDSSDNIYITGQTQGGLDENTTDIFLLKYLSSGAKEWTKQLGSSKVDVGWKVTSDSSDNIYITGRTKGGLDGNTNFGDWDSFVMKFTSSQGGSGGYKQWTRQFGTTSLDYAEDVIVDSSDNIYVTGYTKGGLDGNTNFGGLDFFIVKYNSSGTKQWTKQFGTSSEDRGTSITVDSSDNIYVTGYTKGGLDGNTSFGGLDFFIMKLNSSGTKQWTKQFGTSSDDAGEGIRVDSSDNIYLTGNTKGGLDGNTNFGDLDFFIMKLNSSGTKQWTKQFGTSSEDYVEEMAMDSTDNIYLAGYTQGGLDGNTSLGFADIFLVKYNSDGVRQ